MPIGRRFEKFAVPPSYFSATKPVANCKNEPCQKKNMTIKEAILKSLDDIKGLTTYAEVHDHIVNKGYYDFGTAKTPASTISALLGDFIRNGDTRVKRIKQQGGTYAYYLTKNEQNIAIDVLSGETKT